MLVEQILPVALRRLVTIQSDSALTDIAKLLSNTHISLVVVCNPDGAMVGVITKTDVVRQLSSQEPLNSITAASVMVRDVTYCRPGDTLHDALSIMKERGFVHIPIIDQESNAVGVLNARDALEALLTQAKQDEAFVRDYIMGAGYH
jgi:CBS domain-containing protein